nr:MAG TPA: hypothetical protein [Caudoviricetes sp.]
MGLQKVNIAYHLIVFSIKWCIFKMKQNNNKVQIAKAIP